MGAYLLSENLIRVSVRTRLNVKRHIADGFTGLMLHGKDARVLKRVAKLAHVSRRRSKRIEAFLAGGRNMKDHVVPVDLSQSPVADASHLRRRGPGRRHDDALDGFPFRLGAGQDDPFSFLSVFRAVPDHPQAVFSVGVGTFDPGRQAIRPLLDRQLRDVLAGRSQIRVVAAAA